MAEVKSIEIKKGHSPDTSYRKEKEEISFQKMWEFFGDVKQEIRKITWTSPEELKTYTKIVVAATFVFGMGIFCVDLMIRGSLSFLSTVIRLIAG